MRRTIAAAIIAIASHAHTQVSAPPPNAPPDAPRTQSGVTWIVLNPPSGSDVPVNVDFVTINYTGWTSEGEIFDSTDRHPDVRTFPLPRLSPGLREVIGMMKIGEKRRMWVPAELSPKKAPVIFDVELAEISRPLEAPADVAAIPADAQRSKSGLGWKVLKPGAGDKYPGPRSEVTVHYTGWTTDGKMFDSSVERGKPSSLTLDAVIPGWREGLRMMVPGERRRFWIPEKLAYRGQRGMPKGMLVFDVELIRFQ